MECVSICGVVFMVNTEYSCLIERQKNKSSPKKKIKKKILFLTQTPNSVYSEKIQMITRKV